MRTHHAFLLGFTAALIAGVGCSSSNNNGGTSTPQLRCSDGGAAGANGVTLNCGTPVDTQTTGVDVSLGGPASPQTTVGGLNFDVTYDPTKLQFVPSANYASPLFPNALIVVALKDQQQGEIVVGIQQPGSDPTVTVPAGPNTVLSLTFQRVGGANFGASPLAFVNSEATGASATITFTSGLALAFQ